MSAPLVSCVMATADRRAFAGQAVWYFLRQDYGRRELIVLDDGDETVADLIPEDDRIRYVRLDRRQSLGAKRNLGCELARGELVAHWDDDDWIGTERLSRQVAALQESAAEVCGLREVLSYGLDASYAWVARTAEPMAGTLVYRRDLWERQRFPEGRGAADADFLQALEPRKVVALADEPFYLAVVHRGNSGGRRLPPAGCERAPITSVIERIGPDADFYAELRNGGPPAAARTPSKPRHTLTVAALFLLYDGYGSMAEYLVRGLARAGVDVNVAPLGLDTRGLSEEFREVLGASRPEPTDTVLYFSPPRSDLERYRHVPNLFVNTMWETNRLPAAWPASLNETRAVVVPTRFVADVCRESGVRVPVEVVPEGIDPLVYHYEERPDREGLTTLVVSTFVPRKNTDVAVDAWKLAFADDPTARLVIKARWGYGNYTPDDPRITLADENEPTRGIVHWYREADVLLALGSEGFGLPLVEGMATGLPVVALTSEGQRDVYEDAGDLFLPVPPATVRPYHDAHFGACGTHGVPDARAVAAQLRWVADNRDEARALGRAAAEWAPRARNVWEKGPAVVDVLERYVTPRRPLRRVRTIWVPSLGLPCGIAEHSLRLAESLPGTEVVGTPDLRRVRLLHVEYEPSLYDAGLTAVIQQAKAHRIPVVVEHHAGARTTQPWERDADLLLATTAGAADVLRRRWPKKRVEHLPLPCPTWFPPRKGERGRVIGAFGFLERYKGYWELLDALRELPGTELLLVSHDKHGQQEAAWAEAAAGLPVRRVPEFLGEEEVARLLAAEADVLAFWYGEVEGVASAAVRVGLATGVPVLTSPTSWFADVRDVTYQPRDLVEGLERLLEDRALRARLSDSQRAFCEEHSSARHAKRIEGLWRTLEST